MVLSLEILDYLATLLWCVSSFLPFNSKFKCYSVHWSTMAFYLNGAKYIDLSQCFIEKLIASGGLAPLDLHNTFSYVRHEPCATHCDPPIFPIFLHLCQWNAFELSVLDTPCKLSNFGSVNDSKNNAHAPSCIFKKDKSRYVKDLRHLQTSQQNTPSIYPACSTI